MCSDGESKVLLHTDGMVVDISNGESVSGWSGVDHLYINGGSDANQDSDFAIAELITWGQKLNVNDMTRVLEHLAQSIVSLDNPIFVAPRARYTSRGYDGGATWHDASGNGRDATVTGSANMLTESGHGAAGPVYAVHGGTATTIKFDGAMVGGGSICSATRYTGGAKGRIIGSGEGSNWLHGHGGQRAGRAYYDSPTNSARAKLVEGQTGSTDWVLMCSDGVAKVLTRTGGVTEDVSSGAVGTSTAVSDLWINGGGNLGQDSDFAIAELITWDRQLSEGECASTLFSHSSSA